MTASAVSGMSAVDGALVLLRLSSCSKSVSEVPRRLDSAPRGWAWLVMVLSFRVFTWVPRPSIDALFGQEVEPSDVAKLSTAKWKSPSYGGGFWMSDLPFLVGWAGHHR